MDANILPSKEKYVVKVRDYFQLLRVHHWIKNFLIFVPLFFSAGFFNISLVISSVFGFVCFSLLSSIIYIFNDIRDIEKDRLHSTKCLRPLASGKIPVHHAIIAIVILSILLIALPLVLRIPENRLYNPRAILLLLLYLLANIGYTLGLKNIPIVDVTILASGYLIRVVFGAVIIGVDISFWLYLVVTMGAYYLGLGKRRNEITGDEKGKRAVLKFYSHNFLDKNMYVCQALCVVFYSLWSIDSATMEKFHTSAFVFTIPLIFIILLRYSLIIETNIEGDPISVLLGDKFLLLLCVIYIISVFFIVYFNREIS